MAVRQMQAEPPSEQKSLALFQQALAWVLSGKIET